MSSSQPARGRSIRRLPAALAGAALVALVGIGLLGATAVAAKVLADATTAACGTGRGLQPGPCPDVAHAG